jgi:hypothetical protein
MDKTIQARTEITDVTLVDLLMVCQALPQDEIEQIEAFTGGQYDPEDLAVKTYSSGGIKWTCRTVDTGEPIVVAGFFQVGVSTWRSFMLATERAWAEFGAEVTQHCKEVVDKVAGSDEFIRIETVCLASRQKATDWYPSIGLEFESTLQSYGVNGENAVMYVRTNQPSKSIIEI